MYTRFTINKRNKQSGVSQGILGAAFKLQKSGQLDAETHTNLTIVLDWLQENFITPDIFDKPENLKGVCWFKDTQVEIIDKVESIVPIMESNSFNIKVEQNSTPGEIIYEDIYQVVAIP
ncbi:MAG: hypothetical protein GY787_31485 [Alteromonadales bacterium]|nr:hypothetical protein [Alteromonadales bacterium]